MSIAVAWFRAFLILILIFYASHLLLLSIGDTINISHVIFIAVDTIVLSLSYYFTLATKQQALILGSNVGFPESLLLEALESRNGFLPFGSNRLVYEHCQRCRRINRLVRHRNVKRIYWCGHCGAPITPQKGKISSDTTAFILALTFLLLALSYVVYMNL